MDQDIDADAIPQPDFRTIWSIAWPMMLAYCSVPLMGFAAVTVMGHLENPRFLAGVGIGGEWSIGASLVSEEWPEERRTWGVCLMHTGYYIGFFLIGAYQEILGDLHNLFGDTNAVHITFNKKTNYKIDTVINCDTVYEILKYVQYNGDEILKHVRDNLEKGVALRKISIEESSHFMGLLEKTLHSSTYLEE